VEIISLSIFGAGVAVLFCFMIWGGMPPEEEDEMDWFLWFIVVFAKFYHFDVRTWVLVMGWMITGVGLLLLSVDFMTGRP